MAETLSVINAAESAIQAAQNRQGSAMGGYGQGPHTLGR